MAFFDFLKGKKKEEANQTEIKSENGTIELEGIEVELPKTEENEMKLELSKKDKPEAVNAAVHKAMTSEDVELYTATGGKLYEEKTDINPSHSQKEPFPQIDVPQQSDIKPKTASEQAPQPENCENNEQRDLQNESLPCQQNMDVECDQPSEDLQTEQEPKKKGFFAKLIAGLDKTRKNILGGVDTVLGAFTKIDEDLFEELEEVLIMADLGVETTMNIIDNLRKRVKKEHITDPQAIRGMLIEEITAILEEGAEEEEKQPSGPTVMLVIGVNGVGKTTTIGKLSCHFKEQGKTVLLGAADTFRAAAIEQLEIWGQRAGIDVVKHQQNSDPAAVVFDAVNAAKSRKIDLLICDTAGRLHNHYGFAGRLTDCTNCISDHMEHNSADFAADFIDGTGGIAARTFDFSNRIFNDRFTGAVYHTDILGIDPVYTGRFLRELVGCLERNKKYFPGRLGRAGFHSERRN